MDRLQQLLPRLTQAYAQGLLVPYLGAGMSANGCPLWSDFVENLEREAGLQVEGADLGRSSDLTHRAARAVRKIKNQQPTEFAEKIRLALKLESAKVPVATEALAEIWWPLVVTTNYDDWFYSLWNERHTHGKPLPELSRLQLCGRSRSDCERVLTSLTSPDSPILWALQGFVGGQAGTTDTAPIYLEAELVVGHSEYRRAAHAAPGFRRAFAEVFRSRSFLFLGSSLSEPYFLNLFDEILELQGSLGHSHYAFTKEGEVDADLLWDRLQIITLEYSSHDELPGMLERLRKGIAEPQPRRTRWSYCLKGSSHIPPGGEREDLEVIRSGLPRPTTGECVALSAGLRNSTLLLSSYGRKILQNHLGIELPSGIDTRDQKLKSCDERVWRVSDAEAFIVVARSTEVGVDYRDARIIRDATRQLLQCAEKEMFLRVHSMLLAAGSRRTSPPYVSLIQMARAFSEYRRAKVTSQLSLAISVVDPSVLFLLASGRLDPQEILSTTDTRFWIEIVRSTRDVVRSLEFAPTTRPLRQFLKRYHIPEGWSVEVVPSPIEGAKTIPSREILEDSEDNWTLDNAGILPGSTLRLSRRN